VLEHGGNEQQQETMAQFLSKPIADLVVYSAPPDYGRSSNPPLSTPTTESLTAIYLFIFLSFYVLHPEGIRGLQERRSTVVTVRPFRIYQVWSLNKTECAMKETDDGVFIVELGETKAILLIIMSTVEANI